MAHNNNMLDTLRSVETPEGIDLELPIAGPVARGYAWLLDMLIRSAIYIALAMVLGAFDRLGKGLMLIAIFALEWWYPVLFEVKRGGVTPGKAAMGLRVLRDDGTPLDWGTSLIRNLLRAADWLPMFYAAGLISMLCNSQFKRLGDLAAGTVVVYRQRPGVARELPAADPEPPPVPLKLAEQKALVGFAERSAELAPDRAVELAEILTPLTRRRGETARAYLLGVAAWLRGRR